MEKEKEAEQVPESGTCDDPAQFARRFPQIRGRDFFFQRVLRSEQSCSGGWRWHKWGQRFSEINIEYEPKLPDGTSLGFRIDCEYLFEADGQQGRPRVDQQFVFSTENRPFWSFCVQRNMMEQSQVASVVIGDKTWPSYAKYHINAGVATQVDESHLTLYEWEAAANSSRAAIRKLLSWTCADVAKTFSGELADHFVQKWKTHQNPLSFHRRLDPSNQARFFCALGLVDFREGPYQRIATFVQNQCVQMRSETPDPLACLDALEQQSPAKLTVCLREHNLHPEC